MRVSCCIRAVGLAGVLAVLTGCASGPQMRFYTLSATPLAAQERPLANASALSLAVGPVDLPEYLDRPQIVTRLGTNQLQVHELNRWGGLLQDEVTSVIARNLSELLNTQRVHVYPSRVLTQYDYRIAVDIRALDGPLGGEVVLDAAWSLIDDARGTAVHTAFDRYVVEAAGSGFGAYAAALSEALARFSRDIAARLAADFLSDS